MDERTHGGIDLGRWNRVEDSGATLSPLSRPDLDEDDALETIVRIAVEGATALLAAFPGGVWLCEYATTSRAEAETVSITLGIAFPEGDDVVAKRAYALRERKTLLIFNACEHILNPFRVLAKSAEPTKRKTLGDEMLHALLADGGRLDRDQAVSLALVSQAGALPAYRGCPDGGNSSRGRRVYMPCCK